MKASAAATDGFFQVTRWHLMAFTRALVHALYDRTVEAKREIRYYYDADVVVGMILGIYGRLQHESDPNDDLIRALLSAGFLGDVYIVRPHALELLDQIKNHQMRFSARRHRVSFRQRVKNYLESIDVLANLAQLHSKLEKLSDPEDRLVEFVESIRIMGPQTFVAYEMAHGDWTQRLRRLNSSVVKFEEFGEDVHELLQTQDVWKLKRAIARAREIHHHEVGRSTSVNDLTDAVALGTIHGLIATSRRDPTQPEVRFHTNTRSLQAAVTSTDALKKLLSYELSPQWELETRWGADLVFREVEYYLLRASFSALRFHSLQTTAEADSVTIDELQSLASRLTEALYPVGRRKSDEDLLSQVEKTNIGRRSLREVLVDMELASFVSRLLREYQPPDALRAMLLSLAEIDIFSAPERDRAPARLDKQVRELTTSLKTTITSVQGWLDLARAVCRRVDALMNETNGGANFHVTNPHRDLGLVRWGKDLDPEDVALATDTVRQLFSGDEEASTIAATNLSIKAEEKLTESCCVALGAVFWMLGLFDRVVTVINNYQNDYSELPLPLDLMRAAARLRQKEGFFSQREKEMYLKGVGEALEKSIHDRMRGRLLIGLAYVSFYIAYSEGEEHVQAIHAGLPQQTYLVPLTWAQESFRFAQRAMEVLGDDPLGHAFALNHAAYVGALYCIDPKVTQGYLRDLHALHESKDEHDEEHRLWHYRFADTIGAATYYSGYAKWVEIGRVTNIERRNDLQDVACRHLATAEQILLTAKPFFGDPEIPAHLHDIQRLQLQIGCDREHSRSSTVTS
jgi:hypothetical protein